MPQQFSISLVFRTTIQTIYSKIISLPQPFSQFRLCRGTMAQGSCVRTDTVLTSPFFLKVWTVIKGLTITDSLSLRIRKLVYCIGVLNPNGKPFNPASPIHSAFFHYFHTLLIQSQELTFPWKPVA